MREPDEKIVMEDWVSGDVLDPSNKDNFNLTMKWIVKFQEETKSELLTLEEIIERLSPLTFLLLKYPIPIKISPSLYWNPQAFHKLPFSTQCLEPGPWHFHNHLLLEFPV